MIRGRHMEEIDHRRRLAAGAALERPALQERLDETFGKRLTLVVAGAGFGKTTLVRQWVADVEHAWYTAGPGDGLDTLAQALAAQLDIPQGAVPVGPRTPATPAASPADELLRAQALAASMSEALRERLTHDLVLVVDDFHELTSAASISLVENLLRQTPPLLHVVVISRLDPAFRIQRLRAQGEVTELGAAALAFTPNDVAEVLGLELGAHAPELVESVMEVTQGWPAAIRLLVEALRGLDVDAQRKELDRLARLEDSRLERLADEVFAQAPEEVRRLVQVAAELETFSTSLCEAVGLAGAADTVAGLERRNLFVQRAPGDEASLVLHPLIRDFSRSRWPLTANERSEIWRSAGAWFEVRAEYEAALRAYAMADDPKRVERLLKEHGPQLVASGAVEAVLEAGERLGDATHDQELDQLLGEANWAAGSWDQALALLERSVGEADDLPPAVAWRMGAVHHLRGAPDAALTVYDRARLDGSDPRGEAHVLAWKASAHWIRGEAEVCRSTGVEAVEAAQRTGELRALAAAHTALGVLASMEGDRTANMHFERALEAAERTHDVLQAIRIRVNWQMPLHEEGSYEQALEVVDAAISQAEIAGFSFYEALGLANRAETLTALGRLEEALSAADAAKVIFERLQSTWVAVAHQSRAEVYRCRGELALARAAYEAGLSIATRSEELQMIVACSAGLAQVLVHEDADEARRLVDRALAARPWWGHVETMIACGWTLLVLGDRERAAELAAEAGVEARERVDPAGIAASLELGALAAPEPAGELSRLAEAQSIRRRDGDAIGEARCELIRARLGDATVSPADRRRAEQSLRERGIRPEGPHAAGALALLPPESPAPVALQTLGGFAALVDGRPLSPADWQSRKARDLVKILVARRGRRVSRDVLIELLWPDGEATAVGNRLSVALSRARSALDPRKQFLPDHFIAADKESIWLVQANLESDVETFLGEAAAVEEPERLSYAESLYAGDFLEDDADADWAISLREEARQAYVELTRRLARDAAKAGDEDKAARYLLRLLHSDRFDERARLDLVELLVRAGRHGDARRRYREYTAAMDEISVEPTAFPVPTTRP